MTHSDFIKTLGGGTEVAALITRASGKTVTRDTVYKWVERDTVPWKWRAHLVAIARKRSIRCPKGFLPL